MNFVVDLTDDDPPHPPPRSDPVGAELSVDVVDLLEDDEDDDDEESCDQEQADDSTNESMPERVRPRHETIDIDDDSDEEPEQQHMPRQPQHASPSSRDAIPINDRHSHSCGPAKRKHETNLHEQADLRDKRRRSNEEAHSSLDEIDDDTISLDSSTSSTAPEAKLEIPAQIQPIHDNAESCSTSDDDSSDVSVNVDQSSESPTTPPEAKLTPPSHVQDTCTKDSTFEMTRDKPIQDGHSTESGSILDETHSKMPVKSPKDNYPPIMLLASSDDDETTPCHSMKSPSSPPEADMPTLEQEDPTEIPLHAGDAATLVIHSTESISGPSERELKVPAKKIPPFLDSNNGFTRYDQSREEPATLPVQIPARAPHASEAPFPQLVVDLTEDKEEEPNFILIESSDEEDEEDVEPETAETAIPIPNQTNYIRGQRYRKLARRWNVRSNSDTYCPTKFQKTKDYNYGKSRSEALAEQEQLLSGAQARMRQEKERLYNLQQEQAFARDGPTFTRPITDLTKLNRNHFKWLDLHARMGLPKDATPTMIKSQYRKLALAYHPDKCKLADATTRFQAVTEAYHQLVGRGI